MTQELSGRTLTPAKKFKPYIPDGGFGEEIRSFALSALELQPKRHAADYDPLYYVKISDAMSAVSIARNAIDRLWAANIVERKIFLTMLVCPPR